MDSYNIVNFDNVWGVIPILVYLLILYVAAVEFFKSDKKRSGGAVSKKHLDHHRNILFAAAVSLVVFAFALYHVTLTPIEYFIDASELEKAINIKDGIARIDLDKFRSNDMKTLLTGFSSQPMILLSVSLFVFFYGTIDHLRCERKNNVEDEKKLYKH